MTYFAKKNFTAKQKMVPSVLSKSTKSAIIALGALLAVVGGSAGPGSSSSPGLVAAPAAVSSAGSSCIIERGQQLFSAQESFDWLGAGVSGVKLGDMDDWRYRTVPAQDAHHKQLNQLDEQIKSAKEISDLEKLEALRTTMESVGENVRRQQKSLKTQLKETGISEKLQENLEYQLRWWRIEEEALPKMYTKISDKEEKLKQKELARQEELESQRRYNEFQRRQEAEEKQRQEEKEKERKQREWNAKKKEASEFCSFMCPLVAMVLFFLLGIESLKKSQETGIKGNFSEVCFLAGWVLCWLLALGCLAHSCGINLFEELECLKKRE